jgi:hypothetical protein
MFDGGRRIAVGRSESFVVKGAEAHSPAHLIVRSAPESQARVRVRISGVDVGTFDLARTGGWVETPFALAAEHVTGSMRIELVNDGPGDFVDFHAWLTQ